MLMVQGELQVNFLPRAKIFVKGIFDYGIQALQESMKFHPNLEKIGFNNNRLTVEAAKALGNVIRSEARHPLTKAPYRTNNINSIFLTQNRSLNIESLNIES